MDIVYERVHSSLEELGLTTMNSLIDNMLANAKDRTFMDVLDEMLRMELDAKSSRRTQMRLKFSGFPTRKTIDEFDFKFQPTVDRKLVDELLTMRFVHNAENVVFLGPPGVGKTHLSIALGMRAIQSGIPAYYTTAAKLVSLLKTDAKADSLHIRLKAYGKFPLMIVDEIGYLPLSREESNLFFQFVSRRYETASTIYTSNKRFSEWSEILGDDTISSAVLDRILHHCSVINIKGESYRLREKKKSGLFSARKEE